MSGPPRQDLPETHELAVPAGIGARAQGQVEQRSGGPGRSLCANHVQPRARSACVDEARADRRDQDATPQVVRAPLPGKNADGCDLADL